VTTNYDPNKYGKLLIDVAPGAIESEEENERVLAVVENLMRRGEGNFSPEEDRMLRMLVVLVEDFEEKAYPIGPSSPAVALRELMREHGLKQTDMLEIFGSQGTVSQVLNGKRDISKSQAKKLSARFHLPVDIFI
jgi:HTH-type transcriptional regulator / antitoxin HigA